ncbi:MAG: demethoxyubiquinone hydroxylase family protein [Proteobacteria bacterium]|nr:demethoxyubiquinone hydroxylase family protein [Pseudomonadota bacterium]
MNDTTEPGQPRETGAPRETGPPRETGETRLPGDLSPEQMIERIIRVDQAGEMGAERIYAGQLAVLGKSKSAEIIRRMAEQETKHRKTFEDLMIARKVRPTVLAPLWNVAGFALGAGTALLGERAAMACTVAVEEAIDRHYAAQAAYLGDDEEELRDVVEEARADEVQHREMALEAGAERAIGYEPMRVAIKTGARLAIWLSERF